MLTLTRTTLVALFYLFISHSPVLASPAASVSCSVTIGSQTTTQTAIPNSSCSLTGRSFYSGGDFTVQSSADVSTDIFTSSGYAVGRVSADALSTLAFNPNALSVPQATATADAAVTQAFSSAGPERPGTITFYGIGGCQFGPLNSSCGGGNFVEFLGNLQPPAFIPAYCSQDPTICTTETLPIELGSAFSVEASVAMVTDYGIFSFQNSSYVQSVTFALHELDGTQVNVQPVPEPSALFLVPFALTVAYFKRRPRHC